MIMMPLAVRQPRPMRAAAPCGSGLEAQQHHAYRGLFQWQAPARATLLRNGEKSMATAKPG